MSKFIGDITPLELVIHLGIRPGHADEDILKILNWNYDYENKSCDVKDLRYLRLRPEYCCSGDCSSCVFVNGDRDRVLNFIRSGLLNIDTEYKLKLRRLK